MKPVIAILSLLCLALATGLVIRYKAPGPSRAEHQALTEQMASYSNLVEEAKVKLADQERLSAYLQSNLTDRAAELVLASNQVAAANAEVVKAQEVAKNAQAESQKLNARLSQVEGERDGLQVKLNELAASINSLNTQIAETNRKLASAEGDRDFLTKELARLQADKAELVRQFNNVAAVRAQLALLREEAAINQRLAWMSEGVYDRSSKKGAQALMAKPQPFLTGTRRSLDVELRQSTPARNVPSSEIK